MSDNLQADGVLMATGVCEDAVKEEKSRGARWCPVKTEAFTFDHHSLLHVNNR